MPSLPPRPSLAHLRKQAKELLSRLRRDDPHATLSDAQHALARQYGVPSWPKLKAHVERAASSPLLFARFTQKARESLFFSRFEADREGSATIEPEHLLLGMMKASEGHGRPLVATVTLSIDDVRAEIAPRSSAPAPTSTLIQLSERTKRVFGGGAAEADRLQHAEIGLTHLLLGIMREPGSMAAALLERYGVSASAIRERLPMLRQDELG